MWVKRDKGREVSVYVGERRSKHAGQKETRDVATDRDNGRKVRASRCGNISHSQCYASWAVTPNWFAHIQKPVLVNQGGCR
jgi:hypothetical protein